MRRLALLLICLTVSSIARAQDVSDAAREQFKIGVGYLEDPAGPRYEEAYQAFRAAYRASPSPKILGNLGLCAMMLERDGEAIDAYERYLAEVRDIKKDERAHIERELATLRASAVPLVLTVKPADAIVVDRRTPVRGPVVVNRYEPENGVVRTRVRAGQHRITIERSGYPSATWSFEAEPGRELTKTIELRARAAPRKPPPPRPKPVPPRSVWSEPAIITGLVVTGALAVATGITLGFAASNHADYEEARAAGDVATGDELRERGATLNIAADVLVGVTIASAAATAAMLIFWPRDDVAVEAALGRIRVW
ncbi:MAG TPA: hypothetical protein VFB62_01495 [Polyangiaceae bacterium]|nr:hypothetical protein [Polyangiaceae bacterium]